MEEKDLDAVAGIEAESFSMPWSRGAFEDTLAMEHYRYFVAEENEKILGYCGFLFAADEGEIPNVCVAATARRRGIGKMLMDVLCEEARECGITSLFLEVRQSNTAARGLYRLSGFEEIGIRKGFYELPKEDAVLMMRRI
ncbi:MAG: ribosomal protein S18-alanine N-acetyltransferase [Lachnospiraceae bacterium]